MAMQSGIIYGRLIVRQAKKLVLRSLVSNGPSPQSFKLVTAYCGFAKLNNNQPRRKFIYGEDAFFVAENRFANVVGWYCNLISDSPICLVSVTLLDLML